MGDTGRTPEQEIREALHRFPTRDRFDEARVLRAFDAVDRLESRVAKLREALVAIGTVEPHQDAEARGAQIRNMAALAREAFAEDSQ